jgi:hypothetical protein
MDIDPRKKYAMKHKERCDKLPDYIKIHIPKCKNEIKDIVIPHKPKPGPPAPPPPPWWKAPLDVPFVYKEEFPSPLAIGLTAYGGARAIRGLDRAINERRARAPRGRIAPEEGERGSTRRRMRARIAPAEGERAPLLQAELAPQELPEDTGAGVFGPSETDSRLAGGVQSALEAGDRAEEAARTIPLTGDGVGGALDASRLPRANIPHAFQPAPRPQRMLRADPRLEDEFGDIEEPDIPDPTREEALEDQRQRQLRSGRSQLPRAYQPEARTARGAPRGAIRPQQGGQSARTGVSDVNMSVRPEPQRQTLTKRRKLRFRQDIEETEPVEHPSEAQIGGGEAGPSGTKPDPMEQIVDEAERQEVPRTGKGKGKAVQTRQTRSERVPTRLEDTLRGRRTARVLQAEREGGTGEMERHSFMSGADHDLAPPASSTDDMLNEIDRLQTAREPRGSIRGPADDPARVVRGRGLGVAQTIQDPPELSDYSPDQGMGDVPVGDEDLENVPLLTTSDGPDRPPRISNIARVKRALGSINPMDRLTRLSQKVSSISVPQLQTTSTTQPTQAAQELQTSQQSLSQDQQDIQQTRQDVSQDQTEATQEQRAITAQQATVSEDTTALQTADTADDRNVAAIDDALDQIGTLQSGGPNMKYANALDGDVGVSSTIAEKLGLIPEALARTTAGRAVGGALRLVGAPIRAVQAVGDAAGGVLRQGVVKLGTRVAGDVGARIALGAARATGLVGSAVGIISGGGVLDPVTDAIGAALLLAIPLEALGTTIRHDIEGQKEYKLDEQGIKGATIAKPGTDIWIKFLANGEKQVKKLMKGVPMDSPNSKGKMTWWKPSTLKAHSQDAYGANEYLTDVIMSGTNYLAGSGNVPVYYNDKATKKSGFVVPLTDTQLKNAISVYQQNPNAFDSFDPLQLRIMGLNPSMSQGAAGATKITQNGKTIYVPTNFSTGSKTGDTLPLTHMYQPGKYGVNSNPDKINYSNAFLSYEKWGSVERTNGTAGRLNYFSSSTPPTTDPTTYIKDAQTVINGMSGDINPQAKNYMINQLAWYKYYNAGGPKPATKLSPPSDATQQQALQNAQSDLTSLQNKYQFYIDGVTKGTATIVADQTAVSQLQTQINQLQSQPQTTTTTSSNQQQLQSYQDQANAYNLNVAQQVLLTEQNLQATTGLTAQDYQGLTKVLQQQITGTSITQYTQNQLANLPRATPQQITSSQGSTAPTTTSGQGATGTTTTSGQGTGVNTRATTSPSGNSGSGVPTGLVGAPAPKGAVSPSQFNPEAA